MLRRVRSFFTLQYDYRDNYERTIAYDLLRYVSVLLVLITVFLTIPALLGIIPTTDALGITLVAIYVVLSAMAALIQAGRVYLARNLLVALAVVATLAALAEFQNDLGALISFLIPLVAAGVLSSRRVIIAVTLFTVAAFVFVITAQPTLIITVDAANRAQVLFSTLLNIGLLAQFFIVFGAGQQRVAQAFSRDIRSLERALLTLTELDMVQVDERTLIAQSLQRLRPGFDRVQIFLLDSSSQFATPYYRALGLEEVQVGQPVDLSLASVISEVVRSAEVTIITPDSGDVRQRHLGAGMQAAVVVPILAEGRVLGVVDFQLSVAADFSSSQREVFRTYGMRLGLALARSRLLSQLYADVSLQQSIISGLRQRVEDLESSARTDVDASTWQRYFDETVRGTLTVNLRDGAALTPTELLAPALAEALRAGQFVTRAQADATLVDVPIHLRGTLLGALTLRLPARTDITPRQRELIQNVTDRLALALENRRLLQQSQAQATREAKANEVAAVLFGTTDLPTLLQTAAEQFNEALGAVATSVTVNAQEMREVS